MTGVATPVHPHGRGDNRHGSTWGECYGGSPPRAWGQSACCWCGAARRLVHPHGRGDNARMMVGWVQRFGSPPRAWGQSPVHHRPQRILLVHPHGRGDNRVRFPPSTRCCGSPPRAWGQSAARTARRAARRFTPTGVGTMRAASTRRQDLAVHPHGRGDNIPTPVPRAPPSGSPPRAWGQWLRHEYRRDITRFTPTGVGTIGRTSSVATAAPVHPHGRGDNEHAGPRSRKEIGSPPRAWGQ